MNMCLKTRFTDFENPTVCVHFIGCIITKEHHESTLKKGDHTKV